MTDVPKVFLISSLFSFQGVGMTWLDSFQVDSKCFQEEMSDFITDVYRRRNILEQLILPV